MLKNNNFTTLYAHLFFTKTIIMKISSILKTTVSLLFIIGMAITQSVNGQAGKSIDWRTDTVSEQNAKNAQFKFRSEWSGAGKKTSSSITLPVDKLKEIMDACTAKGITDVQVYIVMIRTEDLDFYARHRPGMSPGDKADMLNRQMLVIKVPRRAFFQAGSGINKLIPGSNPLMLSLLSAGLLQIDNPKSEGTPQTEDDSIYFSFGKICPPPAICDYLN